MQLSDCIRFMGRIGTEKCLYDLYKPYGLSKSSPVAQVMRCNCQTAYGPKIVFTIPTDCEAVFSDRISLSILDMTVSWLRHPKKRSYMYLVSPKEKERVVTSKKDCRG